MSPRKSFGEVGVFPVDSGALVWTGPMRIAMKPVDKPPPGCSLTIWTVVFEVRRRPDLDGRKPPGGVNTVAIGSRDRAPGFFGRAAGLCGRSVLVFCSEAIKT